MKHLLTCILFTFLLNLTAQEISVCGYYGENAKYSPSQLCKQLGYENTENAEKAIRAILDQIGLQMNFLVVECNGISNAYALNMEGDIGEIRYIIYDRGFLEQIQLRTQTDWSAVSILAHEIGHHLNGHTLDDQGSRPPKELEADEFSGFALYKLGVPLEAAQSAMSKLAGDHTSKTHPGKADRLQAIESGWKNAESLVAKYQQMSRNADYTTYAKKWFEKAYAIQGNTEQDHINRVAYYGKATEYRADYTAAYRNRAKYLNLLGLYKEALKDANRAISLDKEMWNAYVEKATAYFGLEQYEEAVKYYNIAIDNRAEPSPYDYAARGWTYHLLGKNDLAKSDLKKALELKPGSSDFETKLNQIGL